MDGAQVPGCGCVCDRDACSPADTQWTPPCVLQTRRVCLHKSVKRMCRMHGPGGAQGMGYHVVSAGRRTASPMTKAQVKAKGTSLPAGGAAEVGVLGRCMRTPFCTRKHLPAALRVCVSGHQGSAVPRATAARALAGGRRGLGGQPARLPELQLCFCWDPWKRGLLYKRNSDSIYLTGQRHTKHTGRSSFPTLPPDVSALISL